MDDEPRSESGVRKHGVLCPVHGLHYNPELTSGCVLCRKEAEAETETEPEPPKRRRRGGIWLLLLAILVAFLFYRSIQSRFKGDQTRSPSPPASEQTANRGLLSGPGAPQTRLDPSPYKEQITMIESILYRKSPPSLTDVGIIERGSEELIAKIGEREEGPGAGRVTADILSWSAGLGTPEESGYAAPQLGRARAEWEELRGRVFETASWFQAASSDVGPAQKPRPPQADPETVRLLQQSARAIVRLIDSGRLECERLGEIVGEGDPQARKKLAEWRQWSREWDERVRRASEGLPGGVTPASNPNVIMAHQSLSSAMNSLRLVPVAANDFDVPFYSERTRRFNEALGHVQIAEDFLARIK